LGQHFFIPSYQRGYRWEERQVRELLQDIWDFSQEGRGDFYCLQPVVVKKRNLADGEEAELRKLLDRKEGIIYEVIDGQQRLTTIYLILKSLGHEDPFSIEYETRHNTAGFLKKISPESEGESESNIDFSHMHRAYQTIEWFKKEQEGGKPDRENFKTKLLENTKVIWYLPAGDVNGAALFDRINRDKIPLTNAELIKALFMQEAKTATHGLTDLKQLEIALAWDQMEYALREPDFWYFLKGKDGDEKKAPPSQIELLFELWVGEKVPENEPYFLFRQFKEKMANLENAWKEIRMIYQRLREWYEDDELYHLVGYLMARRKAPKEIKDLLPPLCQQAELPAQHKSKSTFSGWLTDEIKKPLKSVNLDELPYGSDNDMIRDILLLFNLQTLITGKSRQRFRFDRFFEEKWNSIEHIHAQNPPEDGGEEETKLLIAFLEQLAATKEESGDAADLKKVKELCKQMQDWNGGKTQEWVDLIAQAKDLIREIKDRFDNLALVSGSINSTLNNNPFLDKRKEVIKMDISGQFIPICTRNVFTKYYTVQPKQMEFWDLADRKAYLNAITSTLTTFLPQPEATNP